MNQRVVSVEDGFEVREDINTKYKSLYSLKSFSANEIVSKFHHQMVLQQPNYLTVQIDKKKHIMLAPQYLRNINHSCEPNVLFDTKIMQLVCLKDIHPGDELTFFYPATEWEISQTFNCNCKKTKCVGLISGAATTPKQILNKYRLTEFIKGMLYTS